MGNGLSANADSSVLATGVGLYRSNSNHSISRAVANDLLASSDGDGDRDRDDVKDESMDAA